jgi:hypothetical protein
VRPNEGKMGNTGLSSVVDRCEVYLKFFSRPALFGLVSEQCRKASELYCTAATPRQYPRCKRPDRIGLRCPAAEVQTNTVNIGPASGWQRSRS